jgi:hypothetical protein
MIQIFLKHRALYATDEFHQQIAVFTACIPSMLIIGAPIQHFLVSHNRDFCFHKISTFKSSLRNSDYRNQ